MIRKLNLCGIWGPGDELRGFGSGSSSLITRFVMIRNGAAVDGARDKMRRFTSWRFIDSTIWPEYGAQGFIIFRRFKASEDEND